MNEYEKFKLKWLADHGYTLKDLFIAAVKYSIDADEGFLDGDIGEAFDTWEFERGFDGEIYPCREEWLESENSIGSCADCRFFLGKDRQNAVCANTDSTKYNCYVEGDDHEDCFTEDDCTFSRSKLSECEKCDKPCPTYTVYDMLAEYCAGSNELSENGEYRFKCCSMDDGYITHSECEKCPKNGCHMCSAAMDAEKVLSGECDACDIIFADHNNMGEFLNQM